MFFGLSGNKAETAQSVLKHRRGVRELKAAGFRRFHRDYDIETFEKIVEVRIGPSADDVWIKTVKT